MHDNDENRVSVDLPVSKLMIQLDPFSGDQWGIGNFSPLDIFMAIDEGRFQEESWTGLQGDRLKRIHDHPEDVHEWHMERCAYLVMAPDPTPLVLDGWGPEDCFYLDLKDGFHRLVSAHLRGDKNISCMVEPALIPQIMDLIAMTREQEREPEPAF